MKLNGLYKAPKGLIRVSLDVEENKIKSATISGDFFMIPEESLLLLEGLLKGIQFTEPEVSNAVSGFYASGVRTPMMGKEDLVKAIMGAKSGS